MSLRSRVFNRIREAKATIMDLLLCGAVLGIIAAGFILAMAAIFGPIYLLVRYSWFR